MPALIVGDEIFSLSANVILAGSQALEREQQMRDGAAEVARKAGPLHRLVAASVDVTSARLAAAVGAVHYFCAPSF